MDPLITINPDICHGKPCIRGLRYPVESVLEWLASGMTVDDILSDYEDLNREDILAVLSYAACEALQLATSSPECTSVTLWLGYQFNRGHTLNFQGMMDLVFVIQQHFENT